MTEANSTGIKRCVYCSAEFVSKIARAKYCSDAHQRAHYRKTKRHGPYSCQGCGKDFYKKNTNRASFCSGSCRTSTVNRLRYSSDALADMNARVASAKEKAKAVREEIAALLRIKAASSALYVAQDCGCCGTPFVRRRRWQRTCSLACTRELRRSAADAARGKRRAIIRGVDADPIDPMKVFIRDRWICHLCGDKTRKSMRGTDHPKAPELEHIISLHEGGSHTWGNVACSCRDCNRAKGRRSFGQLGLQIPA